MRRKTYCSQKPPTELEPAIKKFNSSLLRLRITGNFKASDLANMNQTALPFVLDDGKSYDKEGVKEVWAQSGQSGPDKRQEAAQLTVFADAVDRVKLTAIFGGKGFQISAKEKQSYDQRVKIMCQEKTWCDQRL